MFAPKRIELIVAADEPALFYDSVASAELDLEAIDVRDGVYGPIYGRHGETYRISAVGDRVVIVPDPSRAADPDGLRQMLTAFLRQVKPEAKVDSDLATLLLQCEPYLERISGNPNTKKSMRWRPPPEVSAELVVWCCDAAELRPVVNRS